VNWRVDNADARVWLPALVGQVDPRRTVVITDPPWPVGVSVNAGWTPVETWATVAPMLPALCRRLVVQIGCLTDPRTIVSAIPGALPYVRSCWLRYNVPSHYGTVLLSADLALVFGTKEPPPGNRNLPGECASARPQAFRKRKHPCQRNIDHVRWLVRWFTSPGDTVIDPFVGSGTTGMAAVQLGRHFLGCDNGRQDDGEPYVEEARRNIAAAAARGVQGDMMGLLADAG